jgi:hypothetical protein
MACSGEIGQVRVALAALPVRWPAGVRPDGEQRCFGKAAANAAGELFRSERRIGQGCASRRPQA